MALTFLSQETYGRALAFDQEAWVRTGFAIARALESAMDSGDLATMDAVHLCTGNRYAIIVDRLKTRHPDRATEIRTSAAYDNVQDFLTGPANSGSAAAKKKKRALHQRALKLCTGKDSFEWHEWQNAVRDALLDNA